MTKKNILSMKSYLLFIGILFLFGTSFFVLAKNVESKDRYWINVNKTSNVATVYEKIRNNWIPIRAMLVSTGGDNTPEGDFYIKQKLRWHILDKEVRGQYCSRIVGPILFHSVWYFKDGSYGDQSYVQFNRLGTTASHGCVRLAVMDSKWIYDNCPKGTKVTIFSSKKPDPLGKPTPIKVKGYKGWDPTDPHKKNPNFKMKPPVFSYDGKVYKIAYGSKYNLLSNVKVMNYHANQDISKLAKVYKIYHWSPKGYVKTKFNTRVLGLYKIFYRVNDKYSRAATSWFKVRVYKRYYLDKPDIYLSKIENIEVGGVYPWEQIKISVGRDDYLKEIDLDNLQVKIYNINGEEPKTYMSFAEAKNYKFLESGIYAIQLYVKNPYGIETTKKLLKINVGNINKDEGNTNSDEGN